MNIEIDKNYINEIYNILVLCIRGNPDISDEILRMTILYTNKIEKTEFPKMEQVPKDILKFLLN